MTPAALRNLDGLLHDYALEHQPHPAIRQAIHTVRAGLAATIIVESLIPEPDLEFDEEERLALWSEFVPTKETQ